jgi:RNA polymerase sigma-70 factor (ECF subfamily)
MAAGLKRSDARHASRVEIEAAINFAEQAAGPDQIVEGRFDLEMLERAIQELPARRRAILLAARIHEMPIQTIADSFGLSRRSVEMELKRAIEYCAGRLGRQVIRRFGPKAPETTR